MGDKGSQATVHIVSACMKALWSLYCIDVTDHTGRFEFVFKRKQVLVQDQDILLVSRCCKNFGSRFQAPSSFDELLSF